MQNPHPTWSDSDWHRQATYVGFDTDEEEDCFRILWKQQKANEEAAYLEAEQYAIEAEREETEWMEAANFLANVDYGESEGALDDWNLLNI